MSAGRTTRRYRFFEDPGHGWLEVPRAEVVASGARISRYSYYDPATDMAYLEEDCDALAFLNAAGLDRRSVPVDPVYSSMPRQLPAYDPADFMDTHVYVVRPAGNVSGSDGVEAAR
jgi:hypothetical protein